MATTPTSSLAYIVIDASFAIAHCAREPSRYAKTKAYLEFHAQNGSEFFAPGVLVSESLFVFCKKLESGSLTATEHANAVKSFEVLMSAISPAPNGEASLIVRTEEIRSSYGCARSADGIYMALAETMTKIGATELVTFDNDMKNQIQKNAPTVTVNVLT